ncbi:hypothetical protein ACP6JC_006544 [Aspergillus fumigatus]
MTQSLPFYLYKLVPSTSPVREPLPERLPVSELDQESGFIHLSTALQVPNTLKYFFKDEPLVYVLRIESERHLYNGLRLGKNEVESIAVWTNEAGWDKAISQAKPWLLY